MVRIIQLSVVGVAVLVATAGQVHAVVIISSFPPTNDSSASVFNLGFFSKAFGFSLAAGNDYSLDSASFRASQADPTNPNVQVRSDLFADVGGIPGGAPLASLTHTTLIGSAISNVTFIPSSPFTLQASTRYWLTFSVTNTGTTPAELRLYGSNPLKTPRGIATFAGVKIGTTFPPTGNTSFINTIQIDGTAIPAIIPEPTSLAVWSMGILGMSLLTRRRHREQINVA